MIGRNDKGSAGIGSEALVEGERERTQPARPPPTACRPSPASLSSAVSNAARFCEICGESFNPRAPKQRACRKAACRREATLRKHSRHDAEARKAANERRRRMSSYEKAIEDVLQQAHEDRLHQRGASWADVEHRFGVLVGARAAMREDRDMKFAYRQALIELSAVALQAAADYPPQTAIVTNARALSQLRTALPENWRELLEAEALAALGASGSFGGHPPEPLERLVADRDAVVLWLGDDLGRSPT
jgi:hypothetical protein